ncbi:molybdopterin-guanine dinucleotide biosynthesis protein B [Faecalicatena sp. AGMB00832]|uniref:Molybdopterin-guanine dinucleotide biosynthesis protein B n=1 Tax=Faecalicatena faecalis TaxID=2726362 RepID=A0ABS6D1B0_9FIRM|nr:molybdopterin-guanine dinucleotide biosynthesis protein B [Faecalicatena faecalis]MBU3875007.1 molybdopterin-guanine dinucleotide biosynthesis protein B [Faecalicatena faecalis]
MDSIAVKKHQRILVVCGVKNSGKTTLIEKIVHRLAEQGVKTAVIKHDGHDFSSDVPGTDSDRFQKAGAYGTAVFSPHHSMVVKEECNTGIEEMISQFPEAEFIIIEGMKNSEYPKIELVRNGISDQPVSNPEGRILIVTDYEKGKFEEETVGFEDIEGLLCRLHLS